MTAARTLLLFVCLKEELTLRAWTNTATEDNLGVLTQISQKEIKMLGQECSLVVQPLFRMCKAHGTVLTMTNK